MKHLVFFLSLLFLGLTNSGRLFAQWVAVSNGMGSLHVPSLAFSGNYVFAGTYGQPPYNGVYLSTNNATNWAQTSLINEDVYSLAVNGNNIFAGALYDGVWLSTDNGTSWTQTSLNNRHVFSLVVNGNNIFAGTDYYGVYLSTNNGTSWTQTSLNNQTVSSLAVSGNYAFAGTQDSGVYKSTNNGISWTQTSLNNRIVYSLAVSGNYAFAGTDNYGVYLSTNNGTSWTQSSLNNRHVYSLAVNGNNVFAGANSPTSFYVSADNGVSWMQRNEGLGNPWVYAVCILNNYIFAGTWGYSVYRRPLDELTGIEPISEQLPSHFALEQNYPNPFNPVTTIRFQIPRAAYVSLKVFNLLGQHMETLVSETLLANEYEVKWDAQNFPSGVYFYRLQAGDFAETRRLVLLK